MLESEVTTAIEKCYGDDEIALRNVLNLYKSKFHPQHYLMLILKWLLLNIYGRTKNYTYPTLSKEIIQDKIEFCEDYLKTMDIVDPGLSHNR